MRSNLKKWLAGYYQFWLNNRLPAQKQQRLQQKNLFIFPSLLGACYLVLITIFWLLGTNYANNLILGLCYLLISIFLLSIFHTYLNLHGLHLAVGNSKPVYAGELAQIELYVMRRLKRQYNSISIGWGSSLSQVIDWQGEDKVLVKLPVRVLQRGLFQPPRVSLKSYYPLGLMRCWCHLAIDTTVLVYPSPVKFDNTHSSSSAGELQEGNLSSQIISGQQQEFQELQLYRNGEPLTQVAWKQFARSGVLYKKHFTDYASDSSALNWHNYPGVEPEMRLQYLCYEALEFAAQQRSFSLQLPGVEIAAADTKSHLNAVLSALALFQINPDLSSTGQY
ncbi:MAG: DUF58 domain-containing protein [Pseudomonadales bacterium]|nr:DUF58 domain-containing protein [Pseudomonadales bacterium]NRA15988.1 DUF58 domain-containing protein [Oceanospirillaceae bacterium]